MMKNISCTVRVLAFVIMHFSIASATCDYHQKSAIGLCSENMKTSGEFAGISVEHVSRHFSNDNIYCGVRLRSSFMDKMINESNDTVFAGDRSLDKSFNAVESLKGDLLTIISNMPKSALYHKSQNIYKFDMGGYVSFGKRMASKKRSLGVFFGITFSNVFTTRFLGFDDLKLRESSIVDPYSKEVPRNKRYENIFPSAYGTNNKKNEFDLVSDASGDMVKISTPILPDFTLMLIKILYRSSVIGIEYTNILELYNGSCVNTCVKIGTNMNMYEDMYYGISNCSAPGKYPNSRYIGMVTKGNKAASSIIVTPYNIVDKDSTISSYNV
ncbi:MAG: hypothetical protein KAH32_06235, partial [Chlamydiia bacterium]|nr:hypothetical protein [Chlamydiia bacterium]